jgi:hypothetical protein
MKRFFIVLPLVCGGAAFAGTTATELPSGTYTLYGVALSSSSALYCPAQTGHTITGTVAFPGNGGGGFEMNYAGAPEYNLPRGNIINQVRFYAFPNVPANGLDGWSYTHPAGTDVEQFLEGKDISGPGNTGELSFALQPVQPGAIASVAGKLAVGIATDRPCNQTYEILLQRVGPFYTTAN